MQCEQPCWLRFGTGAYGFQRCGQGGDRGRLQKDAGRDLLLERRAEARGQLDRQQGIAAQAKEIVGC